MSSLAPAVTESSSAAAAPADVRGLEILLVEDDDDTREAVVFLLNGSGARVETSRNVEEAFRRRRGVLVAGDRRATEVGLGDRLPSGVQLSARGIGWFAMGALHTLAVPDEKRTVLGERLTVLSIAPIIASALLAVFEDESVSEIFHGENQP